MNLATFRSRISGAIGLSNTNGSTEQSLIDGWVNEGVVDFLRKTKMHVRPAALALTANTYRYELDTDILAMRKLWLEPSGAQSVMLEPIDLGDLLERRTWALPTGYPPAYYALEGGNALYLYPTPTSSSDVLHIHYVPRPAALAATADTPSATANGGIPSEFHPAIEFYALWKGADYVDDQSSGMGQLYLQNYQAAVAEAKGAVTRKAGVRLQGATWGRRNRVFPTTPGTDLGV